MRTLLCLAIVLVASFASAEHLTIASSAWEPFLDVNREDKGISINILDKVMSHQGHTVELLVMPWARSLSMLEKSKVDILPAVWYTEERSKTMLYSEPYLSNRLVFIKRKGDAFEYNGSDGLKGKVLGVVREYAYDGKILDDNNITFAVANSLDVNIRKLIAGRIDLTIEDEIVAKTTIPPELRDQIEMTKHPLSESPLHITCNKHNPKCEGIIASFNQGLAALKADGTLKKLLDL